MGRHEQLAIDLEGIQAWGASLDGVRMGLDQPVQFAAGDGGLGSDQASKAVEDALADFDKAWNGGREVIDSYMTALSKMCDDTVARIRALDQSLAPPVNRGRGHMRMD